MRPILIICSLIYSSIVFAQEPNPELFQTWYLKSVILSDASQEPFIVSEISPFITPTLTFQEDLSFSGEGACNSFSGTFIVIISEQIETDELNYTELACEAEVHNSFEAEYFQFLQYMSMYSISENENGMTLSMATPIFGQAIFQNYTLGVPKYDEQAIRVYPNPSNSKIKLSSENVQVKEVEVFNSIGERVKVIRSNFNTVDISDLSKGLYYLKIKTQSGNFNKRIIKE